MIDMKARRTIVALLLAALAIPASAFANGRGGWHGRPSGGAHFSGHPHVAGRPHFAGHPRFHHFRSGPIISFGVIGAPAFFYPSYPAYYGPAVVAPPPPPPVYIEQYPWDPTPGVSGVVCPSAGMAPYPQVTQCPGGWARVVPSAPAG